MEDNTPVADTGPSNSNNNSNNNNTNNSDKRQSFHSRRRIQKKGVSQHEQLEQNDGLSSSLRPPKTDSTEEFQEAKDRASRGSESDLQSTTDPQDSTVNKLAHVHTPIPPNNNSNNSSNPPSTTDTETDSTPPDNHDTSEANTPPAEPVSTENVQQLADLLACIANEDAASDTAPSSDQSKVDAKQSNAPVSSPPPSPSPPPFSPLLPVEELDNDANGPPPPKENVGLPLRKRIKSSAYPSSSKAQETSPSSSPPNSPTLMLSTLAAMHRLNTNTTGSDGSNDNNNKPSPTKSREAIKDEKETADARPIISFAAIADVVHAAIISHPHQVAPLGFIYEFAYKWGCIHDSDDRSPRARNHVTDDYDWKDNIRCTLHNKKKMFKHGGVRSTWTLCSNAFNTNPDSLPAFSVSILPQDVLHSIAEKTKLSDTVPVPAKNTRTNGIYNNNNNTNNHNEREGKEIPHIPTPPPLPTFRTATSPTIHTKVSLKKALISRHQEFQLQQTQKQEEHSQDQEGASHTDMPIKGEDDNTGKSDDSEFDEEQVIEMLAGHNLRHDRSLHQDQYRPPVTRERKASAAKPPKRRAGTSNKRRGKKRIVYTKKTDDYNDDDDDDDDAGDEDYRVERNSGHTHTHAYSHADRERASPSSKRLVPAADEYFTRNTTHTTTSSTYHIPLPPVSKTPMKKRSSEDEEDSDEDDENDDDYEGERGRTPDHGDSNSYNRASTPTSSSTLVKSKSPSSDSYSPHHSPYVSLKQSQTVFGFQRAIMEISRPIVPAKIMAPPLPFRYGTDDDEEGDEDEDDDAEELRKLRRVPVSHDADDSDGSEEAYLPTKGKSRRRTSNRRVGGNAKRKPLPGSKDSDTTGDDSQAKRRKVGGQTSNKRDLAKKPKPRRKLREDDSEILASSSSVLTESNLRSILTYDTFTSKLTEAERAALLPLLPEYDRENLTSLFGNAHFQQSVETYRNLLKTGMFDPQLRDFMSIHKESQWRKKDPWKRKHYEDYWGQKLTDFKLPAPVVVDNQKKGDGTIATTISTGGNSDKEADVEDSNENESSHKGTAKKRKTSTRSTAHSTEETAGQTKRARSGKQEVDTKEEDKTKPATPVAPTPVKTDFTRLQQRLTDPNTSSPFVKAMDPNLKAARVEECKQFHQFVRLQQHILLQIQQQQQLRNTLQQFDQQFANIEAQTEAQARTHTHAPQVQTTTQQSSIHTSTKPTSKEEIATKSDESKSAERHSSSPPPPPPPLTQSDAIHRDREGGIQLPSLSKINHQQYLQQYLQSYEAQHAHERPQLHQLLPSPSLQQLHQQQIQQQLQYQLQQQQQLQQHLSHQLLQASGQPLLPSQVQQASIPSQPKTKPPKQKQPKHKSDKDKDKDKKDKDKYKYKDKEKDADKEPKPKVPKPPKQSKKHKQPTEQPADTYQQQLQQQYQQQLHQHKSPQLPSIQQLSPQLSPQQVAAQLAQPQSPQQLLQLQLRAQQLHQLQQMQQTTAHQLSPHLQLALPPLLQHSPRLPLLQSPRQQSSPPQSQSPLQQPSPQLLHGLLPRISSPHLSPQQPRSSSPTTQHALTSPSRQSPLLPSIQLSPGAANPLLPAPLEELQQWASFEQLELQQQQAEIIMQLHILQQQQQQQLQQHHLQQQQLQQQLAANPQQFQQFQQLQYHQYQPQHHKPPLTRQTTPPKPLQFTFKSPQLPPLNSQLPPISPPQTTIHSPLLPPISPPQTNSQSPPQHPHSPPQQLPTPQLRSPPQTPPTQPRSQTPPPPPPPQQSPQPSQLVPQSPSTPPAHSQSHHPLSPFQQESSSQIAEACSSQSTLSTPQSPPPPTCPIRS